MASSNKIFTHKFCASEENNTRANALNTANCKNGRFLALREDAKLFKQFKDHIKQNTTNAVKAAAGTFIEEIAQLVTKVETLCFESCVVNTGIYYIASSDVLQSKKKDIIESMQEDFINGIFLYLGDEKNENVNVHQFSFRISTCVQEGNTSDKTVAGRLQKEI